ncbi:MAG TPA: CoA-transferase, partial [Conexibacter sp.]|nr:CoA-transferase [Conexibacter sp.]
GFLGAAQIDRRGNLNSTVIGPYDHPKVRLPGGGGAPEIAALCRETYVVMPQSRRSFVERVDFVTSFGYGSGGDDRRRAGILTAGPTQVVTDLCLMRPDPVTRELTVVSLHPGVIREQVSASTGWPVRFADDLADTPPPTAEELDTLRDLQRRTERAHAGAPAAGAA